MAPTLPLFHRIVAMVPLVLRNKPLADVQDNSDVLLFDAILVFYVERADNLDEAVPSPEVFMGDFFEHASDTYLLF